MAITPAAHADLSTRILALVAEYAAASDRREAEAKARTILELVEVSDSEAGPSVEEGRLLVAEVDRRGQVIADVRAQHEAAAAQATAALAELAAVKDELEQTKAALDAAQKPKDDQA